MIRTNLQISDYLLQFRNNKMLRNIAKRLVKLSLYQPLRFRFSGEGHHHEIDYHAVVTKNMKSGTKAVN